MQDAIDKARTLIEACEYIERFRRKIAVVKFGGNVVDCDEHLESVLADIVFMETVGLQPVIVYGSRRPIDKAMKEAGVEPKFVRGLRQTDDKVMAIVEHIVNSDVKKIIDRIDKVLSAIEPDGTTPNHSEIHLEMANVLGGERLTITGDDGENLDVGNVGRVTSVDRQLIDSCIQQKTIPILSSLCVNDQGERLNVNSDSSASAVAKELGASKLVILTHVNGVREDKNDPQSVISTLTVSQAEDLIASGRVDGGMLPKLSSCIEAVKQGVAKAHIIDGSMPHALLLEIYTDSGIGTQIIGDVQ